MSIITRAVLSRTLFAGFVLSFVGAKDCLGGDVSLGANDSAGAANGAGNTGIVSAGGGGAGPSPGSGKMGGDPAPQSACQLPLHPVPCTGFSLGYNFDPQQGKCLFYCSVNATFSSLEDCQNTCGAGANATEAPLAVDANGQVTSAPVYGVSGPFYRISDSVGSDGTSRTGNCEQAGHAEEDCARVITPPYSDPGVIDWRVGGLMCTSGTVEGLLEIPGSPGMLDYGSMWGAGLAFNLLHNNPDRQPYDAGAHGVIGIAFDIDRVPARGLRVELLNPATVNAPPAWEPVEAQNLVSPVQVGRNVVLFRDVRPLPVYEHQFAFDPSQLLSVQFHVPTTNQPADFDFCISNLALVLAPL